MAEKICMTYNFAHVAIPILPKFDEMGLYHPLDGDTNLKYKLLCFLTPKKNKFQRQGTSF